MWSAFHHEERLRYPIERFDGFHGERLSAHVDQPPFATTDQHGPAPILHIHLLSEREHHEHIKS
jgi:hypothetical protein